MSARAALLSRLFPGDPTVWRVAAVLGALLGALLFHQVVLVKRDYYTGTNSVTDRSQVADVKPGGDLCVPGVRLPEKTGRIRLDASPRAGGGALRVTVRTPGRAPVSGLSRPLAPGQQLVDVPIPPVREAHGATLCVRPLGIQTGFAGVLEPQVDDPAPRLDGRRVKSSVALWLLPPSGEKRTFLQSLPDVLRRASLFRPAPIGAWTYGFLLLLFPLLAYASLRLVATASDASGRRLPAVVSVALIAFASAASWSLITPAFDAPDEMDHYAYAQSLATTGKSACRSCPDKSPYSTELVKAIEGTNLFAYNESGTARPPWLPSQEREWQRRAGPDPPQDDGGGGTTAATHGPYYYLLLAPAYLATDALGGDVFARLHAMRLTSALLAALTAALVFLTARELFPRQRLVAVGAGLFVALSPMVGFIGGALNNDNGVNAIMALLAFLLVRILRRGLTPLQGASIAAILVVAPAVKITGYAAYPPVLLTLVLLALRHHRARDLKAWATTVVTFLVLSLARSRLAPVFTFDGESGVGGTGGSPTQAPVPAGITEQPLELVSYIWQIFLPRLPFMNDYYEVGWPFFDIYVVRGFAAFGWYAITFPLWVYASVVVVMAAIALLAISAARGHWAAARSRWRELLVLAVILATVVGSVHTAFFSLDSAARLVAAEQGRYVFTALVPLGLLVAASCYGLGRRHAAKVVTTLLMLTLALGWASQLQGMVSFFS